MNKLVDIILQHKDEFRLHNPIPTFYDLLALREKENIPPTPEGLHRLTEETMDLVIAHSELPQYLPFMDLFHSDVLVRISPDTRQQFIALTKYFLLQFPRGAYTELAKTNPTSENLRLKEQYEIEFNKVGTSLKDFTLSERDVEVWIRTMFTLHQEYEKVVDEAAPYKRDVIARFGSIFNIVKAVENGSFSLDKERYDKEVIVEHRYYKSIPYFMHDSNLQGSYGPDFIGPFGIFHPVSEKCRGLPKKLKMALAGLI